MEFESVRQLHRALLIPELLNNILSLMDRDESAVNARVCKQWSDIALDLIWREVVGLARLLELLKPGYNRNHRFNAFDDDRPPNLRDWERFQKYANRVRILRYEQGPVDHCNILNDMAMTRPKFEILPNLHTLEWLFQDIDCMKGVTLFMHQRVRHLVISAPPQSYDAKSSFFLDVCGRMPHLHSLDLRVPYSARLIEKNVVELLRGLSDLEEVIFREFDFTPAIVSELSRMKHINSMQFKHGQKHGFGGDVMPVLQQGAFPMLQKLRITERLEDVTRFMNIDFSPINIASLSIDTYVEHEPEQLHMLLVTLSDRCHLLSELCIRLVHVPARGWAAPLKLNPAHQIMFDTLRPVLSFRNLTAFEVFHKYPINITLEEIEELASRWPSLKSLSLNEEPLVMSDFTLDLRALLPFARHCPNLYRLGLFMYAAATIHPMQELKPFTALRVLCVGTSLVRDPEAVTAFLSHICPPGCELEVGLTWPTVNSRHELDNDVLSRMQSRSDGWRMVHDVLPTLIRLRRDEKERSKALIAALQEEVEDLRTRNRLLVSKSN